MTQDVYENLGFLPLLLYTTNQDPQCRAVFIAESLLQSTSQLTAFVQIWLMVCVQSPPSLLDDISCQTLSK